MSEFSFSRLSTRGLYRSDSHAAHQLPGQHPFVLRQSSSTQDTAADSKHAAYTQTPDPISRQLLNRQANTITTPWQNPNSGEHGLGDRYQIGALEPSSIVIQRFPSPDKIIQPLTKAWSTTHPAVVAARHKLSEAVAALRAAPATERANLFDKQVAQAQQALLIALNVHLNAVRPLYDALTQDRTQPGDSKYGDSKYGDPNYSRAANPMLNRHSKNILKAYDSELKHSQREYETLQRVFSIATAQTVNKKYREDVKPLPGGGCMVAMYKGLEVLFSPKDSKALRVKVYTDARKADKGTKRDTNNVDRIMQTLRSQGRAGAMKKSSYNRRQKTWVPSIESHVLGMVDASIPGWFFFGLSISGAYHTVMLAVDTTSGTPKIFWLDQFTRGFQKNVTGKLDAKMAAKWLRPRYGYTTSKVWPIIPQANAASSGDN